MVISSGCFYQVGAVGQEMEPYLLLISGELLCNQFADVSGFVELPAFLSKNVVGL